MSTLRDKMLEEAYNNHFKRVIEVEQELNDFFSEERVDVQYPSLEEFKEIIQDIQVGHVITLNNFTEAFPEEEYEYKNKIKDCSVAANRYLIGLVLNNEEARYHLGCNEAKIYIHFPKVRVTNEYDKYIDITHLYAKFVIGLDGTLYDGFQLLRSEYTYNQFISGYMHSHIPSFDPNHYDYDTFMYPCTGSGPINDTMRTLRASHDIDMWKLFCVELDKYVQVESISGVPYYRLEDVGVGRGAFVFNGFVRRQFYLNTVCKNTLLKFVPYFLSKKLLKYKYINGQYFIGMTFPEYVITFSNCFIEWYNDGYNKHLSGFDYSLVELQDKNLINKCIIVGDKIHQTTACSSLDVSRYNDNKLVLTFKGKPVYLKIEDSDAEHLNPTYLVNPNYCVEILQSILKTINFNYGRI